MFHLTDVFEFIVDRFYNGPFPQHDFIVQGHQAVFHVVADSGYQMYAPGEQYLDQFPGDLALVPKEFPEDVLQESLILQGIPVINVCLGYGKVKYLSLVVYHDVELEPIKPAHCRLPNRRGFPEHPVPFDALVLAHPDRGRIHERNALTSSQTAGFEKYGRWRNDRLAKFNEAVVGYGARVFVLHVPLNIEEIEVLEAPKAAQVEECADGDHFALGHRGLTL